MIDRLATLRRDRGLLLLLAVLLLGLPLVTTRIFASDEIKYFAYLHSLAFDHDLDFTNDYHYWADVRGYKDILTLLKPNPDTHLPINEAPIGTALFWAPAYALAHGGVLVARALGVRVAADGYSPPYIAAVCYASYLYGWAGLLLGWRLLRQYVDSFLATLATLAVWLGTSAFFYTVIAPPWSHAVSLFTVSLFTTVWWQTRAGGARSLRAWAGLGVCAGLMMLVREQDALFLSLPAVESLFLLGALVARRRAPEPARAVADGAVLADGGRRLPSWPERLRLLAVGWALLLVCAVVTFLPQLVTYRVTNGHFRPSSTVGEKLNWLSPHAFSVLLDPQYGLLPWAPVVVLALAGLALLARRDRALAVALLVAFVAQVFVAGAFSTWQGKSSFGQRRFVNCTVVFILGLGSLLAGLQTRGVRRPLLAALAGLCVAWEGGLVLQYYLWSSAQKQAGLQWPGVVGGEANAYARLPELAWRFVFDRKSMVTRGIQ